jgi:hypothetical protein
LTATSQGGTKAWLALLLVLAAFTIANLLTATRSPTVWRDEVLYADPGINLATGRGFTSTAWQFQPSNEIFISNLPGHSLVLAGWIKFFGISVLSVRTLDLTLAAVSVGLLYAAIVRLTSQRNALYAALFAAAMMGGYGIAFSYRSARPDMVGIVVGAAILLCGIGPNALFRYAAMIALGALLPLCGLQLVPYFCAIALGALIASHRQSLPKVLAIAVGIGLGLAGWVAFLFSHGLWNRFVSAVNGQSKAGRGISERLRPVFQGMTVDVSSHLVLAGLVIVAAWQWRRGRLTRRSPAFLGLLSAVLIPLVVGFAGNFPIYYSWMKFVPMTFFLVLALLEEVRESGFPRWMRVTALGCLALSAIFLPLRVAVTLRQWEMRSYAPVEELIRRTARPEDVAFCSIEAYYPVKKLTDETYVESYLPMLTEPEKKKITILFLRSQDLAIIAPQLGGSWKEIDRYTRGEQHLAATTRLYDLVALRRSD